ncbi:PEP-utilizing enzyme [Ilumatobacter sp.]|uniref:PEP-utilizing enzyme n=1 Tax=Ilumatobacter sp. TaxID=1967498 RepID=UPI003C383A09
MTIIDPTTGTTEPTRYWSSANIGEATPDVLSPMCWSFWGPQAEMAARRSYQRFGILASREVIVSENPNELMTNYFYGRPALNVDVLRPYFGSVPGVSADDFERDMCGKLRPSLPPAQRKNRLPFIVAMGPYAMWKTPRRLRDLVPRQRTWWETEVRDRTSIGDPIARLADAAARYRESFEIHCCGRFVLMSAQSTLTKLTHAIDRPDLLLGLIAGLGGVTEVGIADDLWQVSRKKLTMEEFVRRHGFHGPNEGNLSGTSWRENDTPVRRLVDTFANRPDDERPRRREEANMVDHQDALAKFLALLDDKQQRKARKAAAALVRSTQANELGKASYLMAIDGGRSATRDAGRHYVTAGQLDDVDDAFYFTMAELGQLPSNAKDIVEFRRSRRNHYRTLSLPVTFTGMPVPIETAERTEELSDSFTGAAGSPGHVEGIANVITDPDTAPPLDEGQILVCRFTDPSWTPLFVLAEALVIDIGGPTSHGAIVARELGIPCVIGTGYGTSLVHTGDRLSVDGSTGEVKVLERAPTQRPAGQHQIDDANRTQNWPA